MANLLLTERCVRSCPYCFAQNHMEAVGGARLVSWEDLIYVADFLEVGNHRHLSLLGGEPTLHPQFLDFVLYLIERRFAVRVFTSGILTDATLEQSIALLRDVSPEQMSFVCNVNDPRQTRSGPNEQGRVERFLDLFGPRIVAGFNIYRLDFELNFLFQLINQYGLQRHLRLGLANPILDGNNAFVRPEHIAGVVNRLFSYREHFERLHVRPSLDCGFPLCHFGDAQLAWLLRHTERTPRFACGPALDIGPDLSVWSCFPLSSFEKRSLFEFDDLAQLAGFYEERLARVRAAHGGIYAACDTCRWREEGVCAGGCAAHSVVTLQGASPVRPSN